MIGFALHRLVSLLASLIVASLVVFAAVEIVPGDPARFMLGINAQPDTVAALRAELGLDRSLVERYFSWVGGLFTGDLGVSYTYRSPVSEIVAERLQVSLPLAVYALVLTVVIAFPVGMIAAGSRGGAVDTLFTGATQLGIAVPNF